jgi:leucyl/phenylalanyl-tRNA--protein transferase
MIPEKLFLQAEFILEAYSQGVFPMAVEEDEIAWFSPDPRGIIPLEEFHIPHGLARRLKNHPFEIRVDTAFEEVMKACAKRKETWINQEILACYCNLHLLGYAHSVEAWHGEALVGGLYGVALGGAFFGESMFHTETDASKVALHALVTRLRERGFGLLDTQWTTPHLATFGAIEIPRAKYLRLLAKNVRKDCLFI